MWHYKGQEITSHDDLHPECTDFVYIITFDDNTMYIGKKCVRSIRRKPPLKGKKRNRRVMTNLPFINYQGSSDAAKARTPMYKEILFQCSSKKTATYLETELLFENWAVISDEFLNENIGGTFYKNSLDGLLDD
jgi:hypothetical protein